MKKDYTKFEFEDATILFKNFSGRPTKYKKEGGLRSFALVLTEEQAEELEQRGYPIKRLRPREEGEIGDPYIRVTARFSNFPPKVYLVCNGKKRLLDEETIGELDTLDIDSWDVIVTPYYWKDEDGVIQGVKPMLYALWANMHQYNLMSKYEDETELPF